MGEETSPIASSKTEILSVCLNLAAVDIYPGGGIIDLESDRPSKNEQSQSEFACFRKKT